MTLDHQAESLGLEGGHHLWKEILEHIAWKVKGCLCQEVEVRCLLYQEIEDKGYLVQDKGQKAEIDPCREVNIDREDPFHKIEKGQCRVDPDQIVETDPFIEDTGPIAEKSLFREGVGLTVVEDPLPMEDIKSDPQAEKEMIIGKVKDD